MSFLEVCMKKWGGWGKDSVKLKHFYPGWTAMTPGRKLYILFFCGGWGWGWYTYRQLPKINVADRADQPLKIQKKNKFCQMILFRYTAQFFNVL